MTMTDSSSPAHTSTTACRGPTPAPRIDFSTIEVPCKNNPMGVKGCGEAGAVGSPGAVINAILDALADLGVTHIDMPATPDKIWALLQGR